MTVIEEDYEIAGCTDYNLLQWLTKPFTLSHALKKVYPDFKVSLIHQGLMEFSQEDTQLHRSEYGFCRQVFLLGEDTPHVFGEVKVPIEQYNKNRGLLDALGDKPIGETMLYNMANITRGSFEYYNISASRLPFYNIPDEDIENMEEAIKNLFLSKLYARRSMFYLDGEIYMSISEVFFPSITNYIE